MTFLVTKVIYSIKCHKLYCYGINDTNINLHLSKYHFYQGNADAKTALKSYEHIAEDIIKNNKAIFDTVLTNVSYIIYKLNYAKIFLRINNMIKFLVLRIMEDLWWRKRNAQANLENNSRRHIFDRSCHLSQNVWNPSRNSFVFRPRCLLHSRTRNEWMVNSHC